MKVSRYWKAVPSAVATFVAGVAVVVNDGEIALDEWQVLVGLGIVFVTTILAPRNEP